MYNPLNDTFERQDGQAHGKSDGDSVTFSFKNPPGFNLSPTVYYVRDSTSTTFKLAGTLDGSVITATGTNTVISGETFIYNDSTDTFQRADDTNHGFSNSQTITFTSIHSLLVGGSLPFNTSNNYTVVNKTDTTFQLMASSSTIYSGGSANQWKVSLNTSRYMYNPVTHFFIREDGENHGYFDGDIIQFIETPDWGFPSDSDLYVTSSDSTKFKLSTSPSGTPILVYSSGSITTDGVNQFVYNSTNDTFERADGSAHGLSVDDTISFTTVSPRGYNSSYGQTIYQTSITYVVTNISGITFRISPKSTGSDANLYIYDTLNNTLKRSDGSAHGFSNGETFSFSSLVGIAKTAFGTSINYNIVNTTATTFQLAYPGQTIVVSVTLGDDDMLLGIEPVFVMYNPETSFWKREDESGTFISNDIKVKFTTSGTGFSSTFDIGSEYYIVNTSNNQFQLSSSSGGSVIQTTEVPTVSKFNGVLSFDSTTNTYQRADGLPHGFTENEGIDLQAYPLTNQTDGTSITKNNFIISTKNVTSTTFQLVVIDLQNNTETLLNIGSNTLNINSRVYSLELFFETTTTDLTPSQLTTLTTNDTHFNKNSIIFKSFNVNMSENTLNNVTDSNKSNRPNKPIGISLGSGGNNGDKVLLFTPINSHDLSELNQGETKLITTHYPYAKRFYNENLMRTERQFTTFSRSTTFSFVADDPKETTYATKQSKGFNIIDSGLDSIGDNVFPSIQGRTLKIPLYFYFQKDIKKALPLIALTKNNPGVEIEITLRPIRDLYLSRFCPIVGGGSDFWNNFPYELQNSAGYYIKNNINNNFLKTTGIQYFLGNNQTSPNTTISGSELTKELDKFSINPQLEYNIIYLDKQERQRLKTNKYQYFIENVRKIEISNKDSQENRIEIKLKVNKPLKELIFIPKRNDTKELNQWDNFTNYVIPNISTTSYSYTNSGYLTMFTDNAISHISLHNIYNSTKTNFPYPNFITENEISKNFYEKDIIKKIRIDSTNDSFKKRKTLEQSGTYYSHQQPSEYYKKKPKDGVYIYSFSLNPQNDTPTGEKMKDFNYTNEDFNIIIDVSEKPNKDNYDLGYVGGDAYSEKNLVDDYLYEINLYSVEYNILEINNGEGNLLFS